MGRNPHPVGPDQPGVSFLQECKCQKEADRSFKSQKEEPVPEIFLDIVYRNVHLRNKTPFWQKAEGRTTESTQTALLRPPISFKGVTSHWPLWLVTIYIHFKVNLHNIIKHYI